MFQLATPEQAPHRNPHHGPLFLRGAQMAFGFPETSTYAEAAWEAVCLCRLQGSLADR